MRKSRAWNPVRKPLIQVALVVSALICGACLPTVPEVQTDTPLSFCSRTGMFYCNSYSVPQMLQDHGWPGSCAVPAYGFSGAIGYVGAAHNGGQSPAYPTLDEARRRGCGNPVTDLCISVVMCERE